jgi:hypothetical protein
MNIKLHKFHVQKITAFNVEILCNTKQWNPLFQLQLIKDIYMPNMIARVMSKLIKPTFLLHMLLVLLYYLITILWLLLYFIFHNNV